MPDLIVNELSFQNQDLPETGYPCRNREEARALMTQFIGTVMGTARFPSIRRELRTEHGSMDFVLADGYSLLQWRNDPAVNRDERNFLRGRASIPFALEEAIPPLSEAARLSDVKVRGRSGFGLTAAWLLEGICLSLASHEVWSRSFLDVEVHSISEEGELSVETDVLRHASHADHFRDHEERLLREQRLSIRDGRDLLEQMPHAFPAVEIGDDARGHILALTGNERYFTWVVECMECANREMLRWKEGAFPHRKLPGPATPESQTVQQTPWLRDMRKFRSADGTVTQFDYHMKNRAENQRMYYLADTYRRKVVIGAITDKLRTAKY